MVYIRSLSLLPVSRRARAANREKRKIINFYIHKKPHTKVKARTHSFQNRPQSSLLRRAVCGIVISTLTRRDPCPVTYSYTITRDSPLYLPSVYGRQQSTTHNPTREVTSLLAPTRRLQPTPAPSSARPQAAPAPSVTPSAPGGALNAPPPLVLIAGARR